MFALFKGAIAVNCLYFLSVNVPSNDLCVAKHKRGLKCIGKKAT